MNTNPLPSVPEMEKAYLEKDPSYEGLFFLGVRTTGIFCRPTCPARKPLPRNVEYFPDPKTALTAGYRPCKRCRPLGEDDQPTWATTLISEIERDPLTRIRDGDLRRRGIDPATVRRHFLKRYGMTFQAYARARRLTDVFTRIREGGSVDDAVFESGYDSHSGFRDAFLRMFGDTPSRAKNRECVMLSWFPSPLGPLVAGATEDGVCLLEFTERRMLEKQFREIGKRFGGAVLPGTNRHLDTLREELDRYFEGKLRAFSLPLRFPGSPFQEKVWQALLEIPYGETRAYKDLAAAIGDPGAVRAVGRANGQNRIAIVIPCHRVVNADGGLGGYGGGLHRKRYLLDLERGTRPLTL